MNILVIGNGFDLENNLPTTYNDFLEFMKGINIIRNICDDNNEKSKKNEMIAEINKNKILKKEISKYDNDIDRLVKEEYIKELLEIGVANVWIEYFNSKQNNIDKTWIDFETEISKVIQALDYMRKYRVEVKECSEKYCIEENKKIEDDFIEILSKRRLSIPLSIAKGIITEEMIQSSKDIYFNNNQSAKVDTCNILDKYKINIENLTDKEYQEKIIKILINDLNNLIRTLEIYLDKYVKNIEVKNIATDIKNINVDKILSFNYTHTYKEEYTRNGSKVEYDFIHGEADLEEHKTKDLDNMVLGIDEYLHDDLKNIELDFVEFKKYFQRIYKKTGCKYRAWINEIKNSKEQNNIYFFGHSLDVTDKDILKELILGDKEGKDDEYLKKIKITIFYYKKEAYISQIANLVKVIGQDNLIELVSGVDSVIRFEQQKPAIKRKFMNKIEECCREIVSNSKNTLIYNYEKNILRFYNGSYYDLYIELIDKHAIQITLFGLITETNIDSVIINDKKELLTLEITFDSCDWNVKIKEDVIKLVDGIKEAFEYIINNVELFKDFAIYEGTHETIDDVESFFL